MEFVIAYEEQRTQKIKDEILQRKILRDSSNPLDLCNESFVRNFRISKEIFRELLDEIESHSYSIRVTSIPNILKLAASLRFFALGMYQKGVGNDFNICMGQSTFSKIFKDVRNIIERFICPKWIRLNFSEREISEAKLHFYNKSQIPGVVGCVDGTHISIIKPKKEIQHLYYNRKGFHSLNAMVICDHKMQIRYVNARYPGSCHDSMIWNLSQAKNVIKHIYEGSGRNAWLLADSGYPLEPFLITPYRLPVEDVQVKYNTLHCKGRIAVEKTFGILKSRFRCLLRARQLHYTPKIATQIVNCCAALHNMCIFYRVEDIEIQTVGENNELEEETQTNSNESDTTREAERNRDMICNSLT